MFKYTEYEAPGPLAALIKKLWTLDNLSEPTPVESKSILPNGCFNIAFIAGKGVLITNKSGRKDLSEGIYFCGQMTEILNVDIHPHSRATMVQLYPWTPVHFDTKVDMSRYIDSFTFLDQLGPFHFKELLEAGEADICREVTDRFKRLFKADLNTSVLTRATQEIINARGDLNMAALSTAMNCSQRYLQKLFKKHIGLTPKQFSNIIKLRYTIDELAYPDEALGTLTTLAITNGFYDQAHFNNAFQSIVKTSPNKFSIRDCFLSFKK